MIKVRTKWLVSATMGCAVTASAMTVLEDDYKKAIQDVYGDSGALLDSMGTVDTAAPEDRTTIAGYYTFVNRADLIKPMNQWSDLTTQVIKNYVKDLDASRDATALKIQASFGEDAKNGFLGCLAGKKFDQLGKTADSFAASLKTVQDDLGNKFKPTKRHPTSDDMKWSDSDQSKYEDAALLLDNDWSADDQAVACCTQSTAAAATPAATDASVAVANPIPDVKASVGTSALCQAFQKDLKIKEDKFRDKLPQQPVFDPADPIANGSRLKPAAIAKYIRDNGIGNAYAQRDNWQIPKSPADDPYSYAYNLNCSRGARISNYLQSPAFYGSLSTIGQSLKCDLLPALSMAYGSGVFFQGALGFASSQTAPGAPLNLNCNQAELAAFAATRPTDLAGIDKQWGVTALSASPWLQQLRTLQPLSPPFPITQVANGAYLTPFGGVGLDTLTGANVLGTTNGTNPVLTSLNGGTIAGSVSGSSSTGGGRGSLTALSTNTLSTSGVALTTATTGARGLTQGKSLAMGVRQVAAQIANNQSPVKNANVLNSSAVAAHKLVSTMSANNAKVPAPQRRAQATASAVQARTVVHALDASTISRTTNEGILGSLTSRVGSTTTTATGIPASGIGSLSTITDNNTAQRQRIEKLVALYIANIESTMASSETTRQQIAQTVANRDLYVQEALGRMLNATPKAQSNIMSQLRTQLANTDKILGSMYSEYNTYKIAILNQSSLIENAEMMGNVGTNYTGYGGTTSGSQYNISGLTSTSLGLPTISSSTTGTGRGSTYLPESLRLPKIWDWLLPERQAWAATGGSVKLAWSTEAEWSEKWNKYLKDYAIYVERKKDEEKKARVAVANMLADHAASITADNLTDSDSDTLQSVNLFMTAIEDETTDLIRGADLKTADSLNLDGNTITLLRDAREEARGARAELDKISLQYKESYPLKAEDNPEVWWALGPTLLLN